MLAAGLTGGIASGKSTVAAIFKGAGAVLIDADIIARQVVAHGRPALQAIVDEFGAAVIGADGALDRAGLGELVFRDARLRDRLERIVHPEVRSEIDRRMDELKKTAPRSVVIQDIPLLFESGMTRGLEEHIVVYVEETVQLQRLMRRDGIDEAQARARIAAQMPLEKKRGLATIVIDNNGRLEETRQAVLALYRRLEKRARSGA